MKLFDVKNILEADILICEDQLDMEVFMACGADLMSDVLALTKAGSLLLTGLTNTQVVRTAHVLDIAAIVIVRGKKPSSDTIAIARELKIPILTTPCTMFETAGRLYTKGLVSCSAKIKNTTEKASIKHKRGQ